VAKTAPATLQHREALIEELLSLEGQIFRAKCALQPPSLDVDVTMLQLKALMQLYGDEVSVGLRVSDLAGRLSVTPGTASTLVDRLVERGLVDRREDPTDRRQHRCRLSPSGHETIARFFDAASAHSRALLATMAEAELEAVVLGIKTLIGAMERLREAPSAQEAYAL